MDPNHYNYQSYINYLQNQTPLPPTSEFGDNSPRPPISDGHPSYLFYHMYPPPPPTSGNHSSYPFYHIYPPPPPTNPIESPIELDNITLEVDEQHEGASSKKKSRVSFSSEKDTPLIQAWLNVSKDPIVRVDQTRNSFWVIIKENYNNYRGQFPKRKPTQLKSRWFQINKAVQLFVGCYKQARAQRKSGSNEKDIMSDAYMIYSQDVGEKFNFEHAWRLLKEESKWNLDTSDSSCKRSKISTAGHYSSSSKMNRQNEEEEVEYDPASTASRPIGQNAAKRKNKAKVVEPPSDSVEMMSLTQAMLEKSSAMKKLVEATESVGLSKMYAILMKDTSGMTPKQLEDHELMCTFIRRKLGQ